MAQRPKAASGFKPLSLAKSSNTPLLGRTRLLANLQTVATPLAPTSRFPKLSAFFSSKIWPWIWTYLKGVFRGKYKPYPGYLADGKDGVHAMRALDPGGVVKISVAGDWGTGTAESAEVAQRMRDFTPDYTIHLGDVYYVGDTKEVSENFLGIDADQYTAVSFPKGAIGTYALPGNHEMYGGGEPYFTTIIGGAGYCDIGGGERQKASFFCLENDHWRIIGLDTGYNSVGAPILGSIPFIKKIPWVGANCALQPELLAWLKTNVKPQEEKKPTLLISHHQYYSVYEEAYTRPAQQIQEFFAGQPVIWIWGHEHRLSIYDLHSPDSNVLCYGRCLGNGGMPVELETTGKQAPLLFQDPRGLPEGKKGSNLYPVGDGSFAGWNGFLNLSLDQARMQIDYFDLKGVLLFSESFEGDPNGALRYTMLANPVLQPPLAS